MPTPPTVISIDDFEHIPGPGSLTWLPVRQTLGLRAFGCNAYVAGAAGEDVVEPHDEAAEPGEDPALAHEELYFVARGHATFTIDDAESEAPAGTYVFIADPTSRRHAVAREAGTTVLSFGGPPTFEPSPWEWYCRAAPLIADPATRREARELLDDALARFPGQPKVLYTLACLEARDEHPERALDHLRRAVAARPQLARRAQEDEDLASLRGDPRFAALVEPQPPADDH